MQRKKMQAYSITSSAIASMVGGTVRPSALGRRFVSQRSCLAA
jgi:hypothetical protein